MAAGVTESDVHAAADAIVARRERPTIERIRAELGRGSPNTVNRHLDSWWAALSGRLGGQVPEVDGMPPEIVELAAKIWRQVLPKATQAASEQLAQAQGGLVEREKALESQVRQLASDREAFAASRIALDQRIGELEAALKASQGSNQELRQRVGDQAQELKAANAEIQRLTKAVAKAETAHASEVGRLSERLAGNEKRLMDRLTGEIEGRQKDRSAAEKQIRRLEDQLKASQAQLLAHSSATIEAQAGVRSELDSLRKAVTGSKTSSRARKATAKPPKRASR
ncbi:MAG: DNA-binding protein [Candidatus Binatota bacterium]|nr:DNA-binding protein [Candidatus Binatota bacterium]